MTQTKTILLFIFLARSTSSSPITGKCFTGRYIKKLLRKRKLESLNVDEVILFGDYKLERTLLFQAKHHVLWGLQIMVIFMSLKTI